MSVSQPRKKRKRVRGALSNACKKTKYGKRLMLLEEYFPMDIGWIIDKLANPVPYERKSNGLFYHNYMRSGGCYWTAKWKCSKCGMCITTSSGKLGRGIKPRSLKKCTIE